MPHGRSWDRDDADGYMSSATGVLRLASGWGSYGGPSILIVRMIIQGSIGAILCGMTVSMFGAVLYGTAALPFLVGSGMGFCFSSWAYYRATVLQAMINLGRYPRLLQLHLDATFPWKGFRHWHEDQLQPAVFAKSWALQSMLAVGFVSAQPALDEITEARERVLIDEAISAPVLQSDTARISDSDLTKPDSFGANLRLTEAR